MISWCPQPLPVVIEGLGDAYVLYIKENGMMEDDEAVVVLKDGGQWRHVLVSQIKSWHNATYGIVKIEKKKRVANIAKNLRRVSGKHKTR